MDVKYSHVKRIAEYANTSARKTVVPVVANMVHKVLLATMNSVNAVTENARRKTIKVGDVSFVTSRRTAAGNLQTGRVLGIFPRAVMVAQIRGYTDYRVSNDAKDLLISYVEQELIAAFRHFGQRTKHVYLTPGDMGYPDAPSRRSATMNKEDVDAFLGKSKAFGGIVTKRKKAASKKRSASKKKKAAPKKRSASKKKKAAPKKKKAASKKKRASKPKSDLAAAFGGNFLGGGVKSFAQKKKRGRKSSMSEADVRRFIAQTRAFN